MLGIEGRARQGSGFAERIQDRGAGEDCGQDDGGGGGVGGGRERFIIQHCKPVSSRYKPSTQLDVHLQPLYSGQHDCHHQQHQDDHLLSQLFITQTSVAVMTSPTSMQNQQVHDTIRQDNIFPPKYSPRKTCCDLLCHKSSTERVVVALLLGALLIIFLTVILSLVYLRETTNQHYSLLYTGETDVQTSEERLAQWGAIHNVKIKPGTTTPLKTELATCQLPQCWSAGRQLMLMADKAADPCTSFFQLACGGWLRSTVANVTGRGSRNLDNVSVMEGRKTSIDKKIKDLILALDTTPSNQLGKVRLFYQSCTNIDTIKQKGFQPATEFLHSKFGKYLAPDRSNQGDLTEVMTDLLKYAGTALFDIGVDIDPGDNNNLLGVVRLPGASPFQPRLREDRKTKIRKKRSPGLFSNNTAMSSYTVYKEIQAAADAQKIGRLFSVVENYQILNNYSQPFKQSTTDEIVGFVAALTKMVPGRRKEQSDVSSNRIYNKYNIAELQSSFRYVNWASLMKSLFGDQMISSQLFLVHFPSFLRQLDRVVSLFGVRVARISLIVLFAQEVLDEVVKIDRSRVERWRYCSGLAQVLFSDATSHLFMKSFTEYDRQQMVLKAKEISKEMRKEAIRQVETTPWLTRQTKSKVMQKLATTKVLVDLPTFYLNHSIIVNSLARVNISDKQFFNNVLNMGKHQRIWLYSLKKLGVSEEVFSWTLAASPLDVNAYRIRQFNSIVLPFGLLTSTLQGSNGVPSYIHNGALGFIIAHEIMHSMDYSGRGFDLQGRLAQVWDQSSLVRYEKRAQCFKKSYSSSHVKHDTYRGRLVQLGVDGENTFDENLCDIEAVDIVSKLALRNTKNQQALPGVNFTKEQTLFINIAQGYCGNMGTLSHVLLTHLSQHSTYGERIDGMMMNSPKFAEAFKCRVGSRMNPAKKCEHMFGK